MPPLPAPLAQAFLQRTSGGPKRQRTQAQLLHAAVRVFVERGIGAATMQEIALSAGVTTATLYNHFSTKEELVQRLASTLAETLCRAIDDSYAHVTDGAERMSIGQRRYVRLAAESPAWTLLLLDVMAIAPDVMAMIERYPLEDLRIGVRQKKFKVPSEAAALDAITGICSYAMRRVALGLAPEHHDVACATLVLRALGMPPDEAARIAKRPLPPLQSGEQRAGTTPAPKSSRSATRPSKRGSSRSSTG